MEIQVEKVISNGHGMGHTSEGEIMFLPDALSGEVFRVIEQKKQRGVRWSTQQERLTASPDRSEPPCPHDAECGGCQLLHIKRDAELGYKIEYFKDVMRRVGKLDDIEVDARDFPFEQSRARGKFHVDRQGRLGFKESRSAEIAEVTECLVIPEEIKQLLPDLRTWSKRIDFSGDLYFAAYQGKVVLEWVGPAKKLHLIKRKPALKGVVGYVVRNGAGRELFRWGEPLLTIDWNGSKVSLGAGQFFQSNPQSWSTFFEWTHRYLDQFKPQYVWDVHAGSGFLTSCLKEQNGFCSEPDSRAVRRLMQTLDESRFEVFHGSAEEAMMEGALPAEIDGVILDPPRAGLSPELRGWLLQQGPAGFLYLSCDLGSFARDLAALSDVYHVVQPFLVMNLNPGSLRLETAAIFARKEIGNS